MSGADRTEARQQRAYALVAEGLERALGELRPGDPERGRLIRCLGHARQRAGLSRLALVRSPGQVA